MKNQYIRGNCLKGGGVDSLLVKGEGCGKKKRGWG